MGRPRREREPDVVWNVKLFLYAGEDDDLIELYRRTADRKRASMVKATMRGGIVQVAEIVDADEDEMFESLAGLVL